MPINVNGYNATFQEFADFAKIMTTGQGDENSIARVGTGVNIAEGVLLDPYGHDIVHDLQVSPDGKTATITQTMTADLSSPGSQMNRKISFGQVTLSQRLVIDLTTEIPTVTDFQISQEFD